MSGADDTAMPMSEEHFLNGLEQETPDQENDDRAALREAWSSGALSSSGSISDTADPSLPRLLTNKSNKLEVQEGEDAAVKQMLWVAENLQEELYRSQELRLAAEEEQRHQRLTISELQADLENAIQQMAVLDDEMHAIQQRMTGQLDQKLAKEEQARQLDKRFISLQALVHIREKTVKEKEDQVADIQARLAEEAEEARAARTAAAASVSGKASPRSEASSTWGTGSESDEETPGKPPTRTLSSIAKETSAAATKSPMSSNNWFRNMLGSRKSLASSPPSTSPPPAIGSTKSGKSLTPASPPGAQAPPETELPERAASSVL